MARNLVREADEKKDGPTTIPLTPIPQPAPEVKVITVETLLINNLDALNSKFDLLLKRVYEGFTQVGVKFPEEKA